MRNYKHFIGFLLASMIFIAFAATLPAATFVTSTVDYIGSISLFRDSSTKSAQKSKGYITWGPADQIPMEPNDVGYIDSQNIICIKTACYVSWQTPMSLEYDSRAMRVVPVHKGENYFAMNRDEFKKMRAVHSDESDSLGGYLVRSRPDQFTDIKIVGK